jgi:hypothetical protein
MKSFTRLPLFLAVLISLAPLSARSEAYYGVNISSPLILSGNLGVYLGNEVEMGSLALRPTVEGELGIGGGKLLIGFDSIGDGLGLGLKGGVLRTWFEPVGADKDNTYFGVEIQGSLQSVVLSLGGYRRVEGDGDGWLGTISLGLRL